MMFVVALKNQKKYLWKIEKNNNIFLNLRYVFNEKRGT